MKRNKGNIKVVVGRQWTREKPSAAWRRLWDKLLAITPLATQKGASDEKRNDEKKDKNTL